MKSHPRLPLLPWFCLLCALAPAAYAQPKSAKSAAKVPPASLTALTTRLQGADSNEIKGALDEARVLGKSASALEPTIDDLLRKGTAPDLATQAMKTLSDLGGEPSSAVIRPYARHRQPELRRAAVNALLKTGGPSAVSALREALSDSDAVVRGTAATGLGTLKAKEAMPELFVALDHRVNEAAASIGQLCARETCEKFAGKLGSIAFDVMTSGFDPILFRPSTEVPDDEKIRIIGRIRELGTPEANKYLAGVQSRWPASATRTKQAIDQAVLATSGGLRNPPSEATP